jgi:hypothetical protein
VGVIAKRLQICVAHFDAAHFADVLKNLVTNGGKRLIRRFHTFVKNFHLIVGRILDPFVNLFFQQLVNCYSRFFCLLFQEFIVNVFVKDLTLAAVSFVPPICATALLLFLFCCAAELSVKVMVKAMMNAQSANLYFIC